MPNTLMHNNRSENQIHRIHLKKPYPYLTCFVIFTSELFLYSLVLCYGVYLTVFCIESYWSVHDGLWPVVTFVSSWIISNTWSQSFCESWTKGGGKITRISLIVTVFSLFLVLSLGSLTKNLIGQIMLYGISGGWISSMISVQIKYLTMELTKDYQQSHKISVQLSRAFALFLFSRLLELLMKFYTPAEAQFILSPLVLNIIPISFLLKPTPKTTINTKHDLLKFRTVNSLSNNVDTPAINNNPLNQHLNNSRSSSVYSLSNGNSSSSDDDDEDQVLEDQDEIIVSSPSSAIDEHQEIHFLEDNAPSQEMYQRNLVSLHYLPQIPEEEEVDDDDDINDVNSKRLSRISAKLEQIRNTNQRRSISSVNNLYRPEDDNTENVDDSKNDDIFESESSILPQNQAEDIPTVTKMHRFCNSVKDNLKNFKRALYEEWMGNTAYNLKSAFKDGLFGPALLSKTTTNLFNPLCMTLVPYLSYISRKTDEIDESISALTIISFSWCIFLKAHTFLKNFSLVKLRAVFVLGLLLQSLSMYCLSNLKGLTWGLLLFGLGHGVVTYSEERAYQHLFGCTNKKISRRWKRRRPILQIFTAIFVIITYALIYLLEIEVTKIFQIAFYLNALVTGVWLFISFVKCVCCSRVGSVRLHIEV